MTLPANIRINWSSPFPSKVKGGGPVAIAKSNGIWTITLNLNELGEPLPSVDPSKMGVLVYNTVNQVWQQTTISAFLSNIYTEQDVTAGNVLVLNSDGLIKINKTVGAATSVTLPASTQKLGPVKIVDWKFDAGTNNITINCSGTDTFQGGLTSWTIAANGGSVVCTPLKDGTGYAIS